jgi:FKBP-type peptidyl-prolyl cis-trans isomerase
MGILATPVAAQDTPAAKGDAAEKAPAPAASPADAASPPASQAAEKAPVFANDKDKLSYTFGQNIGKSFKQQDIDVNVEVFVKGIEDAQAGRNPLISQQEMGQIMMNFQKDRMAKMATKHKEQAEKNLKDGEAFLAENKKKEGVITLPSGLQYKIINSGTGKTPKETDKVSTNYRGTLIDGTEFDSSYQRGEPTSFPVNGVIKGWTEALQLMKEGDKWQLFVPANLAYGERGAGGKIGPNATLIFEIELLKVEAGDAAPATPKAGDNPFQKSEPKSEESKKSDESESRKESDGKEAEKKEAEKEEVKEKGKE